MITSILNRATLGTAMAATERVSAIPTNPPTSHAATGYCGKYAFSGWRMAFMKATCTR